LFAGGCFGVLLVMRVLRPEKYFTPAYWYACWLNGS